MFQTSIHLFESMNGSLKVVIDDQHTLYLLVINTCYTLMGVNFILHSRKINANGFKINKKNDTINLKFKNIVEILKKWIYICNLNLNNYDNHTFN